MSIKLKGSSDGSVSFDAPADTSPSGSDITLTLPTSAGSANQFLKNSGIAGELEYSSMVETSTGVGIGTSSPSRLLTIQSTGNANFCIKSANTGVSQCMFGDTDSDVPGNIAYRHSENAMAFEVNSSERARLDSSGRLGVGTSSPGCASGGIHAVHDATEGTPSFVGNEVGVFQRNFNSSQGVSVGLIGGSNGSSNVNFGDKDDADVGLIRYAHSDNSMRFSTSATERMRIDHDGTQHNYRPAAGTVIISRTGQSGFSASTFRGYESASSISTGTVSFVVYANGNVQNKNNSYGQISDVKLKENIVDANSQWDDLKALQIRNWNYKPETGYGTHTQIGVVAQEVETVSPGLVYETPDRDDEGVDLGTVTKGVNYSVLYMKAVKALQEAQTRIETLESQHADLLARVTALEAA